MEPRDLAQENNVGYTALFFAAASGMVELAREIMTHSKAIATEQDDKRVLPIDLAASLGHEDMVVYLYGQTKNSLNDEDRSHLLVTLIQTDLYDVALRVFEDLHEKSAIGRAANEETALHALARKNLNYSHFTKQYQRGFFSRVSNLGAKDIENKRQKALKLVQRLWEKVVLLSDSRISNLIAEPELIFDAARQGNLEFLLILIREYPDLIWNIDENGYTIFHTAVLHRRKRIFKLIYQIGAAKDLILKFKDQKKNNILHLAAMLPPQDRLNIVSGAALQMQRELLWFEAKNEDGLTPRALFTRKHENLREQGEKWMKDTATSCMLAATLIATVVFAAAFTVPGGNKGDTGFPFFLEKVSFKIFAISEAISLVSSSASIVNFLSILTSRYTEKDFLRLLPKKLLIGLATLFVSIAAMMVVFSAAFFIVFKDSRLWVAILVTVIASIPVIMFIVQHRQLLCDVVRSTYVSNSLFQRDKISLFHKEDEASERQRMTKLCNGRLAIQCLNV
ncbi:PGG domain-containing protein [Citrus sinensis]|uniref:PGG domain-containing protein n=1 Tax=Citrus sinensis TaxID=2711 RepID=A0ACB8JLB0_CITSI|nr:PGG domain-containing protein [Citrus sinensis]